MDTVAIDSDWLPWCKSMGMYMPREELRDRILSGALTIIVDVRDDDHQGVKRCSCCSLAWPSTNFPRTFWTILQLICHAGSYHGKHSHAGWRRLECSDALPPLCHRRRPTRFPLSRHGYFPLHGEHKKGTQVCAQTFCPLASVGRRRG
jgi:hypothetical protein